MLLRLTQAIYIHYMLVGSLVGMRARYENPPPALGFPHSRASVLRKDEKFTGEEGGGGGGGGGGGETRRAGEFKRRVLYISASESPSRKSRRARLLLISRGFRVTTCDYGF